MFRAKPPLPVNLSSRDFFAAMRWIDKTPLLDHVEPYRLRLFERFFDERDDAGNLRYNLALAGRGKKNFKTCDLVLACFYALFSDSPAGSQVFIIANDKDQAADDLELAKKLRKANPVLASWTTAKANTITRKDGGGFIEVLAAGDAIGSHGKTYRLLAADEIHGLKNWDLLEALAPDPTRRDSQQFITSYASLYHRPGVPLFDMMQAGKANTDPRMLFSWYAADFCNDPAFADLPPEQRANPSMQSWGDAGEYLTQQRRRLPSHKFRRLHLNLPGSPEGSAFQAEMVMDAIARGTKVRAPERGMNYFGFVDMSGGSNDDACLAIAHQDASGVVMLDTVLNQGAAVPFDPRRAVARFVDVLRDYKISGVTGDAYAGLTFQHDFLNAGISYTLSERTKSQLYEALEPLLNGHKVVLPDISILEEQALGLVWRGGRIDHANSEHDDHINAAAGAVVIAAQLGQLAGLDAWVIQANAAAASPTASTGAAFYGGSGGRTGVSDMGSAAYGFGGGLADLGKKAFGS